MAKNQVTLTLEFDEDGFSNPNAFLLNLKLLSIEGQFTIINETENRPTFKNRWENPDGSE